MQETQFSISRAQAEGFAKVWKTPGGIHVVQTPQALQFATDFANVTLASFISMCKHQAQQAHEAAKAQAETPTIELVEG